MTKRIAPVLTALAAIALAAPAGSLASDPAPVSVKQPNPINTYGKPTARLGGRVL